MRERNRPSIRVQVRERGTVNTRFKPGNEQKVELVGGAQQLFPHLQVEILGRHRMSAGGVCELNNQNCVQDIGGFGMTQQDGKTVITEVTSNGRLKGCATCPVNVSRPA